MGMALDLGSGSPLWQQVARLVAEYGPAGGVVGYGAATGSDVVVVVGGVFALVQDPVRRVLGPSADALGEALAERIRRWGKRK